MRTKTVYSRVLIKVISHELSPYWMPTYRLLIRFFLHHFMDLIHLSSWHVFQGFFYCSFKKTVWLAMSMDHHTIHLLFLYVQKPILGMQSIWRGRFMLSLIGWCIYIYIYSILILIRYSNPANTVLPFTSLLECDCHTNYCSILLWTYFYHFQHPLLKKSAISITSTVFKSFSAIQRLYSQ